MIVEPVELRLAFDVVGRPVAQGSLTPTIVNGKPGVRYLKADQLYEWRAAVARACPVDEPVPGPFAVAVGFRLARPQGHRGAHGILPRFVEARPVTYPDLDKLVRAVLDALTGRVWVDDSQVVQVCARKHYVEEQGRPMGATIEVWRA